MAKCDSKGFVIRNDQIGKLKSEDIIMISVLDALASCSKIDTRTIIPQDGSAVSGLKEGHFYNAANVPEDAFGCSKNKCYNTGTYQGAVLAEPEDVIIGDFKKTMDATLYATGIVTAYILLQKVTIKSLCRLPLTRLLTGLTIRPLKLLSTRLRAIPFTQCVLI